MRRLFPLLRTGCLLLAFGLAFSGGEASAARGGRKKGSSSSSSGSRKRPPEIRLKNNNNNNEASPEPGNAGATSSAPPQRGPTRIDFDDRLIQGQTNKSGAVYLYERKELKTRSMLKMRDSFREEIVGSVYDG